MIKMTSASRTLEIWTFANNDESSNDIEKQKLFDEPVPQDFSMKNVHQLSSTNIISFDKWLATLTSMFFANCFTRWSETFNSHNQVISRDYDSFATVIIDNKNVYVVHYENIMLTKVNHDRFSVRRLMIETKVFGKGENVKKKFAMKKDFEIRAKMRLTIEKYIAKRDAFSFSKMLIRKKAIAAKAASPAEGSLNLGKDSPPPLEETVKREARQARELKRKGIFTIHSEEESTAEKDKPSAKAGSKDKITKVGDSAMAGGKEKIMMDESDIGSSTKAGGRKKPKVGGSDFGGSINSFSLLRDIESTAITKPEESITSGKTNRYKTANLGRTTGGQMSNFGRRVRRSDSGELKIVKEDITLSASLLIDKQAEIDKLKEEIRHKDKLLDKAEKLARNLGSCLGVTSRITATFSEMMYFAEDGFNLPDFYATDHGEMILEMKTLYGDFFSRYAHNLLPQTRIFVIRLWMKNETSSDLKAFCEENETRFFEIETLFESEEFAF